MKLTKIETIQKLEKLTPIKNKEVDRNKYLDEMDIILYTTNLCLYASRVANDEIKVNNKYEVLNKLNIEINNLYNLLSKKDFIQASIYTQKSKKEFFKSVGLKTKHFEN